jgi:hypothetical protein
MMSQARYLTLLTLLIFVGSACVSVNIKPNAVTKSKNYRFTAPASPFQKMTTGQADHAWQDEKNGNTIAVYSECSEGLKPTLSDLQNDVLQVLSPMEVLNQRDQLIQDIMGRRAQARGEMDGRSVEIELVVFTKDNCAYTLTLMGRAAKVEGSREAFNKFLTGFSIP